MKLRSYTAAVVLSTALLFINPADVDAASTITASIGGVSVSTSETKLSSDNIRFAQVLSSIYNSTVSPAEIIQLRRDFDFGLDDISLIYGTAAHSGHSVDEISRSRYGNMGWGEIAKLYGVKVKDLKRGNEDVIHAAQMRGVDVRYIEIGDDEDYDRHDNHDQGKDNHRDDHKKNNKHDDNRENTKDRGHKK